MKQHKQNGSTVSEEGILRAEMEERLKRTEIHSGMTVLEIQEALTQQEEMIYIEGFVKGLPSWYRDERTKGDWEIIRVNPDGSEDLILYGVALTLNREIVQLAGPGKGKMAYLLLDPRCSAFKRNWEQDGK